MSRAEDLKQEARRPLASDALRLRKCLWHPLVRRRLKRQDRSNHKEPSGAVTLPYWVGRSHMIRVKKDRLTGGEVFEFCRQKESDEFLRRVEVGMAIKRARAIALGVFGSQGCFPVDDGQYRVTARLQNAADLTKNGSRIGYKANNVNEQGEVKDRVTEGQLFCPGSDDLGASRTGDSSHFAGWLHTGRYVQGQHEATSARPDLDSYTPERESRMDGIEL